MKRLKKPQLNDMELMGLKPMTLTPQLARDANVIQPGDTLAAAIGGFSPSGTTNMTRVSAVDQPTFLGGQMAGEVPGPRADADRGRRAAIAMLAQQQQQTGETASGSGRLLTPALIEPPSDLERAATSAGQPAAKSELGRSFSDIIQDPGVRRALAAGGIALGGPGSIGEAFGKVANADVDSRTEVAYAAALIEADGDPTKVDPRIAANATPEARQRAQTQLLAEKESQRADTSVGNDTRMTTSQVGEATSRNTDRVAGRELEERGVAATETQVAQRQQEIDLAEDEQTFTQGLRTSTLALERQAQRTQELLAGSEVTLRSAQTALATANAWRARAEPFAQQQAAAADGQVTELMRTLSTSQRETSVSLTQARAQATSIRESMDVIRRRGTTSRVPNSVGANGTGQLRMSPADAVRFEELKIAADQADRTVAGLNAQYQRLETSMTGIFTGGR